MGAAGAIAVYVAYYPSDSIAIEDGDGLWFAVLAIAWMTLVAAVCWFRPDPESVELSKAGFDWIDFSAIGLATWMMVAAFLNAAQSDLRMGTNEAWWWASAAAILIASRRVLISQAMRQSFLLLTICVTVGLAVDALHQDWISLPATRASYQADPDAVVRAMGIDAPPDSSTRMVLENRLMDGGPTATFALANSLAALMLIGVVLIAAAIRFTWTQICVRGKVGLIGCLVVLVPALLAVRSRAALAATLIGIAMVCLTNSRYGSSSPLEGSRVRSLFAALVGVVLTGILGLIGLAMFGNPEWYGQAPASLAFRLQYWAATWRMMLDHILLGAGPGNFQSLYDRYRDANTTEQIADPHNFLLETLSSGGPIALCLLIAIFVLGFKQLRKHQLAPDATEKNDLLALGNDRTILIGGAVMLAIIWFLGLLTLHAPDISSHRFAVPIALGLGWSIRSVFQKLDQRQLDLAYVVSLIAILVHLSVSGGWTVPGVAFWVWMMLGGLTRIEITSTTSLNANNRSTFTLAIGLLALVLLTFMSVRPVGRQSWLLSIADASLRSGNTGKSGRILAEAVDADRWSSKAPILNSEFLYREIIRRKNSSASRRAYDESAEVAIDRAGPSPTVMRQLATQRLHLYQVFGKPDDLEMAEQYLQTAWQGSPANQWLAAQLAEIALVKNDKLASDWVERAETLSKLGNNPERLLRLQLLYIAEPVGDPAALEPVRKSAKERLFLAEDDQR